MSPTPIKIIANGLKNSFLFELSLGSKELFHSNILGWLFDNYKKETLNFLSNHLSSIKKLNLIPSDIIEIKREEKNIDLTIKFKRFSIFIENKVKAYPTTDQLDGYATRNPQDIYILVTLAPPDFLIQNKYEVDLKGIKITWHYISYTHIADSLLKPIKKSLKPKLKSSLGGKEKPIKDYVFITDYITFINNLSKLVPHLELNESNDMFNFYHGDELNILRELRMDDFYLKYKYQKLCQILTTRIRNLSFSIKEGKGLLNTNPEASFSNGSGILTYSIQIPYDNQSNYRYQVGVQLQANQFRMFICCEEKRNKIWIIKSANASKRSVKLYEMLKSTKNVQIWPSSSFLKYNAKDNILLGEGKKFKNNYPRFNFYFQGSWLYKYVNLEGYSIKQVLEEFELSIAYLCSVSNKIKELSKNI